MNTVYVQPQSIVLEIIEPRGPEGVEKPKRYAELAGNRKK